MGREGGRGVWGRSTNDQRFSVCGALSSILCMCLDIHAMLCYAMIWYAMICYALMCWWIYQCLAHSLGVGNWWRWMPAPCWGESACGEEKRKYAIPSLLHRYCSNCLLFGITYIFKSNPTATLPSLTFCITLKTLLFNYLPPSKLIYIYNQNKGAENLLNNTQDSIMTTKFFLRAKMAMLAKSRANVRLPPEVNRILLVRNLPFKISSDEMYDLFGKYVNRGREGGRVGGW